MVFFAIGQQLSGLIIESQECIILEFCSIQNKFTSIMSSGIVNVVNTVIYNFSIVSAQIIGFNFYTGVSGYFAAQTELNITIYLTSLDICQPNTPQIGIIKNNAIITQFGSEYLHCENICGELVVAYGLCVDQFNYSYYTNGTYQCQFPFQYNIDQCVCTGGYLLNDSKCINILNEIYSIKATISQNNDELQTLFNMYNHFTLSLNDPNIQQYIVNNISIVDNRIADNVSFLNQQITQQENKFLQNIIDNSSLLELRILQNASAIYQNIADNMTLLNNNLFQTISQNFAILDLQLYDNTTAIHKLIETENNKLLQNIIDNTSHLVQWISQNESASKSLVTNATMKLTQNIMDNTTNLDQRIYDNISTVYSIINEGNSQLLQIIVDNSTTLDHKISSNFSSLNQKLTEHNFELHTLIHSLQEQIDLLQNKQDKLPLQLLDNMFQQDSYDVTDMWMICNQPNYVVRFQITFVTNIITASNFTNGSVFGQLINVQNVFIDVISQVYTSAVQPLYDAQNQFYNIKVQIGAQVVESGNIFSNNNAIIINQLSIVSKIGNTFEVNSVSLVTILQIQSNHTKIQDMMICLIFQTSTGNIGLIGSLSGNLNVINYQITGQYETEGYISLGVNSVNLSKVVVKNVNFNPESYKYGNQSSYLVNFVFQSNIEIFRSTISLNSQSLNYLQSTNNNHQEFGGLIMQLFSSRFIVSQVSYNTDFQCNTQYIANSGLLLGKSYSTLSQIIFQGLCIKTIITANSSFSSFGIIGQMDGNVTIKQSNIQISMNTTILNNFGLIGFTSYQSSISTFQDILLTINIQYISGDAISGIVGQHFSKQSSLSNISLTSSNINGTGTCGGFIAILNSNILVQNGVINNLDIKSNGNTGSIAGNSNGQHNIINIMVSNIIINSSSLVGGLIALSSSEISILNGAINNFVLYSNMSVGGYIAKLTLQIYARNLNATVIHIISIMCHSSGGIVGLTQDNNNSTISGIFIQNVNISFGAGSGGVVGYSTHYIIISDSLVQRSIINATNGTGGILGQATSSYIINCQVISSEMYSNDTIGGIIGLQNYDCTIQNSVVHNNTIIAILFAGGVIGNSVHTASLINVSAVNSSISSTTSVAGGIIAITNDTIMERCNVYDMNVVSGSQSGGVIGVTYGVTPQTSNGRINIQIVNVRNLYQLAVNGHSSGVVIGITKIDATISYINIKNASLIALSATGAGGIVGVSYANVSVLNSKIYGLIINNGVKGNGGAGIIAYSNISSIVNCSVENSIINAVTGAGSIIGTQLHITENQTIISNVYVRNVTLSSNNAGGLIGFYNSSFQCNISNSKITQVSVIGKTRAGLVTGNSPSNYLITSSSSEGDNFVNGVLQENCIALTNTNARGC
ncbi:Conserved_hypothetical protein [Hexamita inflata]|uniref:Uncharacterized protein n=1 Tax=Hexamita inflata TaxID=28002 RepID=A0AA86QRZ7_9EUKA|nr:Conserved hypothetical protein [Hexamita inflata]